MSEYNIETKCVQSGYVPKDGEARVVPIVQSTTYKFDSAERLGNVFDLKDASHIYTRISNPTTSALEEKIAALCGGVGAVCTSSGQAAILLGVLNITSAGQNIISSSSIYGGTVNLFASTFKKMGIEVRFITQDMSDEEIEALIDENTRLIYGETIANPALTVFDIERFAKMAHSHGIPLFVDNTFATPYLCRPFEFGADIVIHSTSKYMDGHATVLGGVLVDSGKFNWKNGKFPELATPDASYHGAVYTDVFGDAAFISKARFQLMRDFGVPPAPFSSFILNMNLETLHLRMQRHSENGLAVAKYLEGRDEISFVSYPLLPSNKYYDLAKKYVPKGACGVVSFEVKGGREAAAKFMEGLKLANIVVHVADVRTSVIHPASTTHRQLTDEQLIDCGISAGLIRMSVGIEDAGDIIADIEQALAKI